MTIAHVAKRAEKFVSVNSPAILTGAAIAGTLATAYLTGKAAFKAAEVIHDYEWDTTPIVRTTLKEKINLTWTFFLPAIGTGALTVTSIFFANRISSKRAAAMATAYAISEKAYTEYREKIVEKLGAVKEQKARDEVAQDQFTRDSAKNTLVVTADGEVLCHEAFSGRFFKSSMEEIKAARNTINHQINNFGYASLTEFGDILGLERTDVSDELGWPQDQNVELEFTTVMDNQGKPALSFRYNPQPSSGYYKFR